MPPSAAPEWLRVGWIFEIIATSAPSSNASIAARIPAQPAPMTSTSCFASTAYGRYRMPAGWENRSVQLDAAARARPDMDGRGQRVAPTDAEEERAAVGRSVEV